jgi:beta-N-acetylhexosaminidase
VTVGAAAGPEALLGRVLLAFDGERLPDWVARRLAAAPAAGMTVFRYPNVRSPGQLRELTEAFQRAGREGEAARRSVAATAPLLVAADQEGGQLQGLGDDPTQFAGNMALGAVADEDLAERVGRAIGLESRAMGVNVVYAPVLDLASEPGNVSLGIRSFGDDPVAVGRLGAAMVRGLQGAGVAATIKHFPGLGEVRQDPHHGLGVVRAGRAALEAAALVPFRAAIAAGARIAMSAHVAVPALTGDEGRPATLSRAVLHDLLRAELGFAGVSVSDALDMGGIALGPGGMPDVAGVVRAGVDLLLCAGDRAAIERIESALAAAVGEGRFEPADLAASTARVGALRSWLGGQGPDPDLSVVGCAEHRALSRELAERSIAVVRGEPLLPASARVLAVMPTPTDLTPADTSSTVAPGLGRSLRRRFAVVEEVVVGFAPTANEIAGVRARAADVDVDAVVIGTIDAIREPAQLELVGAVAGARSGRPTVAVAMRTPWDVAHYPANVIAVCTYSILPDPLDALAAALVGAIPFPGRLPVLVDGVEAPGR